MPSESEEIWETGGISSSEALYTDISGSLVGGRKGQITTLIRHFGGTSAEDLFLEPKPLSSRHYGEASPVTGISRDRELAFGIAAQISSLQAQLDKFQADTTARLERVEAQLERRNVVASESHFESLEEGSDRPTLRRHPGKIGASNKLSEPESLEILRFAIETGEVLPDLISIAKRMLESKDGRLRAAAARVLVSFDPAGAPALLKKAIERETNNYLIEVFQSALEALNQ